MKNTNNHIEWLYNLSLTSSIRQRQIEKAVKSKDWNKKSSLNPVDIWGKDNFFRNPIELKTFIWKNRLNFTYPEFVLLDYLLSYNMWFNKTYVWYKFKDIMEACDFKHPVFYNTIKSLEEKLIIKVFKMSYEDRKLYKTPKKIIVVNTYYDKWILENVKEIEDKEYMNALLNEL